MKMELKKFWKEHGDEIGAMMLLGSCMVTTAIITKKLTDVSWGLYLYSHDETREAIKKLMEAK